MIHCRIRRRQGAGRIRGGPGARARGATDRDPGLAACRGRAFARLRERVSASARRRVAASGAEDLDVDDDRHIQGIVPRGRHRRYDDASMGALRLLPRLIYFAVVPFILVVSATVLPLTGVIVNIVLLLVGFVVIGALRRLSDRHWIVRAILRRQVAFASYYEAHPPRNFAYYVFFPLLAPILLFSRRARQELALYRGFTRIGVVLITGHLVLDYQATWAPEIAAKEFVAASIGTFIVQMIALFAFVLPLATSVITLHLRQERRALRILLGAAALSVAFAGIGQLNMRTAAVPAETRKRVELRSEAAPARAVEAQERALARLWQEIDAGAPIDHDGLVGGEAVERVQAELVGFYRDDEAAAFTAHAWPVDAPTVALVQMLALGGRPPVWRASDRQGQAIDDAAAVPAAIYNQKVKHSSGSR